jgi:uncharacterized PurR-regulated membrane protein YhhQ (DUF165 family)
LLLNARTVPKIVEAVTAGTPSEQTNRAAATPISYMSSSNPDRWLLPRRQTEYPTRELVAEEKLHGRREATFLVLAALFLVTAAALVVLGTSRILDPSSLFAVLVPDRELPFAMAIPFGALPFALGALALTLVCELYGRRRAMALLGIGLGATLALAALMRFADQVDGADAAFGPALGFVACVLVAYLVYVPLFDALRVRTAGRHLWLRLLVLSLVAQLAGWTAFGAATYGYASLVAGAIDGAAIVALATGSALYTLAVIALLTLPVALIARGLALFLRVARHDGDDVYDDACDDDGDVDEPVVLTRRRLPPAQIVDDAVPEAPIFDQDIIPPSERRQRRAAKPSVQPFSSAEMQFFREGDLLAESGADS